MPQALGWWDGKIAASPASWRPEQQTGSAQEEQCAIAHVESSPAVSSAAAAAASFLPWPSWEAPHWVEASTE